MKEKLSVEDENGYYFNRYPQINFLNSIHLLKGLEHDWRIRSFKMKQKQRTTSTTCKAVAQVGTFCVYVRLQNKTLVLWYMG